MFNLKFQVYISFDHSFFVFSAINIEGLDQFLEIFNFEFLCEILVNKHSTSATVNEGFDNLFT